MGAIASPNSPVEAGASTLSPTPFPLRERVLGWLAADELLSERMRRSRLSEPRLRKTPTNTGPMKWGALVLAIAGLAASAEVAQAKPHVSRPSVSRPPVVVELFTAQGCGSCGAASAHVSGLTADKGVLPLTFAVDYWDYLGWKDTFAKPEFADRQRAYEKRFDVAEVFTPQVVVDGRSQTAAVKAEEVDRLVRDARRAPLDPPQMGWRGDRVAIGGGRPPKDGAEIWLIRYDPREQDVEVKDGDNRGHTVAERNVVVQLERLGPWRGRPLLLHAPPPPQDGLRTLVLVQAEDGGRILGVLDDGKS